MTTEIVDPYEVAEAAGHILQMDKDFSSQLSVISRDVCVNQYINEDPNRTPWCGVYLRDSAANPGAIPRGYKLNTNFTVVLQAASLLHTESSEKLKNLSKRAVIALLKNPTLKGTVETIKSIETIYTYTEKDKASMYFQMCMLNINTETNIHVNR